MSSGPDSPVALVTGAGSGIGRESALTFARAGYALVIADIDGALAKSTVTEIEAQGGKAVGVEVDVSRDEGAKAAVAAAVGRFGRLDAAHNNAGVQQEHAPVGELAPEEWNRVIGLNLTGVFYCLRHEVAVMVEQRRGAIVSTCSTLGLIGAPEISAYVASKHGVAGLTKAAALEYATCGVRVNAVCPGFIETKLAWEVSPELRELIIASHPIGRIGTPAEVAAAVLWLCSDNASFVTGTLLSVDGGYTAR